LNTPSASKKPLALPIALELDSRLIQLESELKSTNSNLKAMRSL